MQATFSYRSVECGFAHTSLDSFGKMVVYANMPGAANAPCITIVDKKTKKPARYYTSKLCITGPIASKGDGELTVFHTCSTNGANIIPVISVFALRTNTQTLKVQHPIDNIIVAAENRLGLVDLNLAEYANFEIRKAQYSKAVLADETECIVLLHNQEIIVDHDFSTFSVDENMIYASLPLFKPTNKESIIEGLTGDDKIYECEYLPINTGETVQTYEIPISSKAVLRGQTGMSAQIISTLTLITVLFVFTFMSAPIIYPFLRSMFYRKNILDDRISKSTLDTSVMHVLSRLLMPKILDSSGNYLLNITNLGSIITIVWISLSLILLVIGGATNDLALILGGLYLFIIISVAVISNTFFSVLQKNK